MWTEQTVNQVVSVMCRYSSQPVEAGWYAAVIIAAVEATDVT